MATTNEAPPKGFDRLVRAAFDAGVDAGSRRQAARSEEWRENTYRAWRDKWAGLPHEPQEQATGNRPQGTPHFQRGSEAGCYG